MKNERTKLVGAGEVPPGQGEAPWEQRAALAGAAHGLSSHSCSCPLLSSETAAWLCFHSVCCQYRLIWIFRAKTVTGSGSAPRRVSAVFSCKQLSPGSYLLAQPFLFLSYRAWNTQKSAAFTPCRAHSLEGSFLVRLQIFKVMLRKENVNCKKLNTPPVLVHIKKEKNLN